ncbi:MAG TPA: hypothetical protein ENJ82_09630 [Bacteroidetes bacterium]|nr:hypothetical protein [Bacteroidota bacterium]
MKYWLLYRPILWLVLLLLAGCGGRERLVVYADPWLGGFAEAVVAAYAAEAPEVEVELHLLSSELVAQHLHFGQPMDVFLCFRPEIMREMGLSGEIASEVALGGIRLVLAGVAADRLNPSLGGTVCTVIAASDRPLRRFTESWPLAQESNSCILYSNFYRQTRDYLIRGWAGQGFVPDFFVRQYPNVLTVKIQGPNFPSALVGFRLRNAPNPNSADKFMQLLHSEKSQSFLAEEKIIP